MKLRILKNSKVLIRKMAIVFQIPDKITQIQKFLGKLKSFFYLSEILSELYVI